MLLLLVSSLRHGVRCTMCVCLSPRRARVLRPCGTRGAGKREVAPVVRARGTTSHRGAALHGTLRENCRCCIRRCFRGLPARARELGQLAACGCGARRVFRPKRARHGAFAAVATLVAVAVAVWLFLLFLCGVAVCTVDALRDVGRETDRAGGFAEVCVTCGLGGGGGGSGDGRHRRFCLRKGAATAIRTMH